MNAHKRILFVDDEPMVLQGLQRMLRPMRQEWDMAFVESGPQALDLMAQSPFDVVVSDMRMPVMNGADLLAEVMKRYPKTVRLILSGHADKDLILKCVGSTHQYLSKPCDPEGLKATLLRAGTLETALNNERLKQLVSQMSRLPSIPSVYTEIVDKLRDPETSLEEIGVVVGRDIGMTASLFKVVNSAFFGLRRQVIDPAQAVAYLGLETVKTLVLALHAFSQFDGVRVEGFSLQELWQHSLETAALAKAMAKAEGAENRTLDECFVSGMLHDAGKVVLAANFSLQYGEITRLAMAEQLTVSQAESRIFGATHSEVGGYLFGLWGLPVPVVEAIALHHQPSHSLDRTFTALTAVHAADVLVHARVPDCLSLGLAKPAIDALYLAQCRLADRMEVWKTLAKEHPEKWS